MKPITIAKNVWNHANELQDMIDKGIVKRNSVMYHYFGILSINLVYYWSKKYYNINVQRRIFHRGTSYLILLFGE